MRQRPRAPCAGAMHFGGGVPARAPCAPNGTPSLPCVPSAQNRAPDTRPVPGIVVTGTGENWTCADPPPTPPVALLGSRSPPTHLLDFKAAAFPDRKANPLLFPLFSLTHALPRLLVFSVSFCRYYVAIAFISVLPGSCCSAVQVWVVDGLFASLHFLL